ncbi:MAG: 3-methyladenine DNA glycosylase [Angustibacter sp.]
MGEVRTQVRQQVLPAEQWQQAQRRHQQRVAALTAGHRSRRASGTPHPVQDFLFTYYPYPPGRLRRWHPGLGVVLLGEAARERLRWRCYVEAPAPRTEESPHEHVPASPGVSASGGPSSVAGHQMTGVTVGARGFLAHRGTAVTSIRRLLAATASRPARFGCFGLHEWAMVYRLAPSERRHPDWPLRLGAAGTDAVVETSSLACTHHDALRFFTPAARPLNPWQTTRADQVRLEQPGCLHAAMDLYSFAQRLVPAASSDLVLACLDLAWQVRELDMRASPYDLRALGYEPVPVETPEGRQQYVAAQRAFTERAIPLRRSLIDLCDQLLAGR